MSEKIWLFDGTNTDGWTTPEGNQPIDWPVRFGYMTVGSWNIHSREVYGDAYLHVEFSCPDMPNETGQRKGNSGIFLHGLYEIQVLDSYGVEDYTDQDCGAIYQLNKHLSNASLPPEEWQAYDIFLRAPRFSSGGELLEKARLTLLHNGIVIHNNIILERPTPGGVSDKIQPDGPLLLQYHLDKVRYRNIWLIKL